MPCGRSAGRGRRRFSGFAVKAALAACAAIAVCGMVAPLASAIDPHHDHESGAAMMLLRSSPASPFGRKVRMAILLLGFDKDVQIEAADTSNVNDSVREQNPLGKIPVLITEDGTAYYDSRVILDYLDHRAGGNKIVPADPTRRFAALRQQALCDGLLDASILTIYEARWRKAEAHEPKWLEHQAGKVTRALAVLEAVPKPLGGGLPDVGQITLACALGYRDFRFGGSWRNGHPRLVAW